MVYMIKSQENRNTVHDPEVSLNDILDFLSSAWKKLVISSLLGVVLGICSWYFFGSYKAQLILINNSSLDTIEWRSMQKTLPNLAQQIIDNSEVPQGQESLYQMLGDANWWQKNATLTYRINKTEAEDMFSKEDALAAKNSIVSIELTVSDPVRQKAMKHLEGAYKFLLEGGSYLAIRALLNHQASSIVSDEADISKKYAALQRKLSYQQVYLKNLEALAKRLPSYQKDNNITSSMPSDSKYLSLGAKIANANTDILASIEDISLLQDDKIKNKMMKLWVSQALPLIKGGYNGTQLVDQLLETEAGMRASNDSLDPNALAFFEGIRSELLKIQARYTTGLISNTLPSVSSKEGFIKSIFAGMVLAFFLALLILLGQRVYINIKTDGARHLL